MKVSIVVPAYNHGRFVERAIESVLGQTYGDVELIVLDDGSTDGTRSVLERYGRRFHWETQRNIGQAATLNKGWRMSKGDLLGYLSADDFLHPTALARAVEALAAGADVVATYPDFVQVDEQDNALRVIRTPEFSYPEMFLKAICAPGPGVVFRRASFERIGGWNESLRHIPDFEYWLRLGLAGTFRRIPEVLASYRVHPGAQSFSPTSEARADELPGVIEALAARPGLPDTLRARAAEARANALLHAARLHILSGRSVAGMRRALAAVAADPGTALRPGSYRLLAGGLAWRLRFRWRRPADSAK